MSCSARFLLPVLCLGTLSVQVLAQETLPPVPALAPGDPGSTAISPSAASGSWLRRFGEDEFGIWSSPLRVKKKDVPWLVPFALGTAALIATDSKVAQALPNTESQVNAGEALSKIGAPYTLGGIAAGAYLFGRIKGDERARETGRIGAEALIHSWVVTHAIKVATGRERPEVNNGRGDFFQGQDSFPSGHSMMAWSLAAVIAHEYPDKKALRYGAYGLAFAVNAGRMMAEKHFPSDSLVGGVFGYLIGTYLYEKRHNRALDGAASRGTKKIPDIVPHFDRASRNIGVSMAWQF